MKSPVASGSQIRDVINSHRSLSLQRGSERLSHQRFVIAWKRSYIVRDRDRLESPAGNYLES